MSHFQEPGKHSPLPHVKSPGLQADKDTIQCLFLQRSNEFNIIQTNKHQTNKTKTKTKREKTSITPSCSGNRRPQTNRTFQTLDVGFFTGIIIVICD